MNNDSFVTREAIRKLFSLVTSSLVKIIAESPHSWQKTLFTVTHALFFISSISYTGTNFQRCHIWPWMVTQNLTRVSDIHQSTSLVLGQSYNCPPTPNHNIFGWDIVCIISPKPFYGFVLYNNLAFGRAALSPCLITTRTGYHQLRRRLLIGFD